MNQPALDILFGGPPCTKIIQPTFGNFTVKTWCSWETSCDSTGTIMIRGFIDWYSDGI